MAKRGLPSEIKMRHDSHYVEELAKTHRTIGKIIPVSRIEPNPEQPRTEIGDLTDLTESIREKGVLEPLLVKPVRETGNYMIIAGERRWRAANLAGLVEVPCIEFDIDEKSIAEIALIENLQRKDLTVWEEADGLAALARTFGYTHDEIAKKISKSRTTVTESMSIAGIPEAVREKCREANINAKSTLLEIARQFDDRTMLEFVESLGNRNLKREDVRQAARPVKQLRKTAGATGGREAFENGQSAGKHDKSGSYENYGKFENAENTQNTQNTENAAETDDETAENIFRYESMENYFTLTISFEEPSPDGKKQILQALKEVFEAVRSGEV